MWVVYLELERIGDVISSNILHECRNALYSYPGRWHPASVLINSWMRKMLGTVLNRS